MRSDELPDFSSSDVSPDELNRFLGDATNPEMVLINEKLNGWIPFTSGDEQKLRATFEEMSDVDLKAWMRRLHAVHQQLIMADPITKTINDVGRSIGALVPVAIERNTSLLDASHSLSDSRLANTELCRVLAYEAMLSRGTN